MGFWGWIIALVLAAVIGRLLRRIWQPVDWIVALLVIALFITVWVTDGFWYALIAGIAGSVIVSLLFGLGSGTEVIKFGNKYTLDCDKCGYDKLNIVEHTEHGVITRCKRCGQEYHHRLKH